MALTYGGSSGFPEQSLLEILPCYYVNPKPPRNVFDRMVTIIVGQRPDTKTFQVHRGLLCHYSGLFSRLLNGPFRDNDSHSLPTEKPESFQLFYDWLYSGEVICDETTDLDSKTIVHLYFFADAYVVQQLKDRTLELYFLRFLKDWEASQDLTRVLYEKTADKSALRKLHVDILLETFGFENIRDYIDDDPKEFMVDLVETCRDKQIFPGSCKAFNGLAEWVEEKKACFCEIYHEHPMLESYPVYEPASDVALEQSNQEEVSEVICFGCGESGHIKSTCPNRITHNNIRCWNCEEKGHRFSECPEPKDYSRLKCRLCRERGHTAIRCPYTVAGNEVVENDGGFGGDNGFGSAGSWGHEPVVNRGGWGE